MTGQCIEIDSAATHPLRSRVLRSGTATTGVDFPEDARDDTVHLGIEMDGELIAISTWIARSHPDEPTIPGIQIRGMATDPSPETRGKGYGAQLLRCGVARAEAAGARIVWANARSTALDFYCAHGFEIDGPEFVTADTGLPHHRIVLRLS